MTVVSLGLQGSYSYQSYRENLEKLKNWLRQHREYEVVGEPRRFFYDGPYIPDAIKRSEIQIPIQPVDKGDQWFVQLLERIISLLPSATEIVACLGLTEALVGRSHECDYPPEVQHLPICTEARLNTDNKSGQIDAEVQTLLQGALSIYGIKTDVIEQLQPTHIFTQDQCDVCAVSLAEVEKAAAQLIHSQPQIISLQPNLLSEVWADIKRVARALGVESRPVLEAKQTRIEAIAQKTKSRIIWF